ncbi:MAG: alpha-E domain-containing protein, partial [Chloroflexi bacterium]|nr:alpha-E domain-containing protein [Chloroflexota bacterium]
MLSRVAENLYWLGRDLERVENIARMAEVSHTVSVESGGTDGDQHAWDAVLA